MQFDKSCATSALRVYAITVFAFTVDKIRPMITQVLQQEAYPAIWPLLTPITQPSLGLSPRMGENVRSGLTATQNFTPIGKAPAEKSVTVHKKEKDSKLSKRSMAG